MSVFKFTETVWFFVILVGSGIIGHVQIPPGVVVVNAVPGVAGGWAVIGCAVYNAAGDVLATAEGGEKIGKIIADTFMGA